MPVPDPPEVLRPRFRVSAAASVLVVLLGVGAAVLVAMLNAANGATSIVRAPAEIAVSEPEQSLIYVHVLGQVASPGVYLLAPGARAVDAVAAAGGYTPEADRAGLNLARFVSDGEQLYVPAEGESPVESPAVSGTGRIDLNRADAALLETLPRVGPALAQRILQWREENGGFRTVEDLLSVTGIGEKTFAGLKDLVTV